MSPGNASPLPLERPRGPEQDPDERTSSPGTPAKVVLTPC